MIEAEKSNKQRQELLEILKLAKDTFKKLL